MKILGLIPARSGSKGIKNKNIKKFAGKPLLSHSIQILKKINSVDKILVSTDDKNIADIAKKYGAQVPFLRPNKFAKDSTPMIDVIKHCVDYLSKEESYVPDIVLLLQPTSPIRDVKMISKSINLLKILKATSVISVSEVKTHPYLSFFKNGVFLKPLFPKFEKNTIRQKENLYTFLVDLFYVFKTTNLSNYDSMYGPRIMPFIVDQKEFNIDIDDDFDWSIAELFLKD